MLRIGRSGLSSALGDETMDSFSGVLNGLMASGMVIHRGFIAWV